MASCENSRDKQYRWMCDGAIAAVLDAFVAVVGLTKPQSLSQIPTTWDPICDKLQGSTHSLVKVSRLELMLRTIVQTGLQTHPLKALKALVLLL